MSARPADKLTIAVAQLNSTVGDIAGNAEKVRRAREQAAVQGADLVVFPAPVVRVSGWDRHLVRKGFP